MILDIRRDQIFVCKVITLSHYIYVEPVKVLRYCYSAIKIYSLAETQIVSLMVMLLMA